MEKLGFVPESFLPPDKAVRDDFCFKKLTADYLDEDYAAVMSSIDIIHQVRNGNWPTEALSLEEDKEDLIWHEKEFETRASFAYVVYDKGEQVYQGCVYFYPGNKPWVRIPQDCDVDVNLWVTQQAYTQGAYPRLFHTVQGWVSEEWPFKKPYYSNKEVPE